VIRNIKLNEHSLPVLRYALAQRSKTVAAELAVLCLTKQRDLTETERWQLPANLQQLSQEQLQEQIFPWSTLLEVIEYLIQQTH